MPITNAQIAAQLNTLLEYIDDRDVEFSAWLNGAVGGGVLSDGRYPLTSRAGDTYQAKSPAQLEDDVDNLVTGAQGFKNDAEAAATAAGVSEVAAELAETNALLYRDTANAHKLDAAASASAAATSEANAQLYMAYAEEWANSDVLITVPAGGNGVDEYSSKYWATAAEVAAGVALAVSGATDGDYGDITLTSSGTVWTIDNGVVTYAKMQDVSAASKLLGRGAGSGSGDVQEITLGTNLSMSGTTLNATGGGGGGAALGLINAIHAYRSLVL